MARSKAIIVKLSSSFCSAFKGGGVDSPARIVVSWGEERKGWYVAITLCVDRKKGEKTKLCGLLY